ncbi:MAG: DUF3786 domain-containing protein [Deltaproteobacteria bacterium]
MATGACGINCDTCRLNLRGICSSCGSGTSEAGRRKMAAQEHLLGAACSLLACAVLNHVDYCLRDCQAFPCENFSKGPYPFSDAYLKMQARRRNEPLPARAPYGGTIEVPGEYWETLERKNLQSVCEAAEAVADAADGLILKVLASNVRIDLGQRCLQQKSAGIWETCSDTYLELLTLLYLLNVKSGGILQEMVSVHDLKDAHFFQGPHALKKSALLVRFGEKPEDLKTAGHLCGGSVLDIADAAIRLTPFPKIPIYYLLWTGDEEFPASLSILFDRSIERHLPADAIWGVVTWVSDALVNTQ